MHIHILGVCGTFMGSLAQLAKSLGHRVTGSDANVYPPMSTQLQQAGIEIWQGYSPEHLQPEPDLVVVGNAMTRGNPAIEALLNSHIPYTSGPQWLRDHVLRDKWVLGVAGTHGKTSTSCMLAWILEYAGMVPGYLIGGVPKNFDSSARLGNSPFFVVEADEYDSAFFDKRSKFVHYGARTLVLNNLEYDHADIFPDLAAIQRQFHHLVRTVPSSGLLVVPTADANLEQVLEMGCWTPVQRFGVGAQAAESSWQAELYNEDGSRFGLFFEGQNAGEVCWSQTGLHNVNNALAAAAAARHVGVAPDVAVQALCAFEGIKRRMECLADIDGIKVYDDFAHHPTAIKTTLAGLRARVDAQPAGGQKIIALIEPRSNTMRMGVHSEQLAGSLKDADQSFIYQGPGVDWDVAGAFSSLGEAAQVFNDLDAWVAAVSSCARPEDRIVVMSNGGFGGIHQKLLDKLSEKFGE